MSIIYDHTEKSNMSTALALTQEQIAIILEENLRLKEQIQRYDSIVSIPSDYFSPADKLIMMRLSNRAGIYEAAQYTDYDDLSQLASISYKTVKRRMKYLDDKGFVDVQLTGNSTKERTIALVKLNDVSAVINSIPEDQKRKHGGKHACRKCGSHNTNLDSMKIIENTLTCDDCGHVERWTRKADCSESPDEARMKSILSRPKMAPGQLVQVEPEADGGDFDDLQAFSEETEAPGQVVQQMSQINLDNLTPIINLIAPQAETPELQGGIRFTTLTDEVMEYASHMLTESNCIFMQGSGPKKYKDQDHPATVDDLRRHFLGEITLGTRIADDQSSTLMYVADADEDVRDGILRSAAAMYDGMIEESPCGRGCHFILTFDGSVDGRSVHQMLVETVPGYDKIKEYWPSPKGNKVRLPGGIYRYGIHEQCKIFDGQGNLIADDGINAAHAMYNRRKPASMIPAYVEPKKELKPVKQRRPSAGARYVDLHHKNKYSGSCFLFEFTPEQA